MKKIIAYLSIAVLFSVIPLFVSSCSKQAQKPNISTSSINKKAWADSVKKAFIFAWKNYKKYAWGHDDLRPLSKDTGTGIHTPC